MSVVILCEFFLEVMLDQKRDLEAVLFQSVSNVAELPVMPSGVYLPV